MSEIGIIGKSIICHSNVKGKYTFQLKIIYYWNECKHIQLLLTFSLLFLLFRILFTLKNTKQIRNWKRLKQHHVIVLIRWVHWVVQHVFPRQRSNESTVDSKLNVPVALLKRTHLKLFILNSFHKEVCMCTFEIVVFVHVIIWWCGFKEYGSATIIYRRKLLFSHSIGKGSSYRYIYDNIFSYEFGIRDEFSFVVNGA